jgi:hypothetical protein
MQDAIMSFLYQTLNNMAGEVDVPSAAIHLLFPTGASEPFLTHPNGPELTYRPSCRSLSPHLIFSGGQKLTGI